MMLDLGCGQSKKEGCIGVDIKKHTKADIFADLEHFPYPFKDNSVDEIWLWGVLEHLFYPREAVNEAHRILKPNGKIYINVPFFQPVHSGTDTHFDGHDYCRYTEFWLMKALSGFRDVKITNLSGKFKIIHMTFVIPKVWIQRYWEKLLDGIDKAFNITDRRIPRNYFVEAVK